MFSQLRQAVEQIAHQVPVPAVSSGDDQQEPRRGSLDLSSLAAGGGHLAGKALHSIATSISRSNSLDGTSGGSTATTPVRKSNLEERLRRAAAARAAAPSHETPSAASSSSSVKRTGSPSPNPSSKTGAERTSTPQTIAQRRVTDSPASTPLPASPAQLASDPLQLEPTGSIAKLDLELGKEKDGEKMGIAKDSKQASSAEESHSNTRREGIPKVEEAEEGSAKIDGSEDANEEADNGPNPVEAESIKPADSAEASSTGHSSQDVQETSTATSSASENPTTSSLSSERPKTEEMAPMELTTPQPPTEFSSPLKPVEQRKEFHNSSSPAASSESPPSESPPPNDQSRQKAAVGIDELQQRLKQVEQRFADVSTSFKRLQAEKIAADAVLRELTPIETIQDAGGLKDYLKNIGAKQEMFQTEIKLLNDKLTTYETRLEELRNDHSLETKAQTDQIEKLRTQLNETEALFQATEKGLAQAAEKLASDTSTSKTVLEELEKYKTVAKEEEEKRVKAVSLLKTVRQKLVKAEKEKEDALREVAASKQRDSSEKEKDHVERLKLQQELEMAHIEKERAVAAQKAQFEREMALAKERWEKELSAVKGGLELEIITLKSSHAKELASKNSQISTLENSLNGVTRDKNVFFEQLQIKQAETESAQSHLESLQHQNAELEFQLREANDRLALLREEYADYQREQEAATARESVTSAADVAQMIAATSAKYEARLAEQQRNIGVLEKERSESEANWARKLKEKVRELDELKRVLGSAAKSKEEDVSMVERLKADLGRAREEVRILKEQLLDVPVLNEKIQDLKKILADKEEEVRLKNVSIDDLVEDHKSREAQLKQANKTLREELRKVQSSAALLERQRNPGVGYWNRNTADSSGGAGEPASPTTSEVSSGASPRPSSPALSAPSTTAKSPEEEVNLEYLRNVILQFLEHKEMRPSLVKVMSVILHFTPQETRRLMAKV